MRGCNMQTQYGDVPDVSLCRLHDFEVRINVRISSLVAAVLT